jgi:hypothetical protein
LHIGFFDSLLGSVGMIVARIRDAIADTRNIARGLSPVALESTGLMVALQEVAENSAKLFLITWVVTEELFHAPVGASEISLGMNWEKAQLPESKKKAKIEFPCIFS